MKNKQFENKARKDAAKIKKDISALVGDSAVQFSRVEDDVIQAADKARKDLTTWVEDGGSKLIERFENLTGDARESVVDAMSSVEKEVGHGLSQYNAKAQEVVNKVPGGIGKKAARYPWVSISIALAVGIMLGVLLEPARKPLV